MSKEDTPKPKKNTKADMQKWLPEAVAKKYEVIGLEKSGHEIYHFKFGKVNFKELTVKKADQLAKQKFPYLQVKGKADKPAEN